MGITLISSGNCIGKTVVIILNTVVYLVLGEQEVEAGLVKNVMVGMVEP
jgi:hypothetical protein